MLQRFKHINEQRRFERKQMQEEINLLQARIDQINSDLEHVSYLITEHNKKKQEGKIIVSERTLFNLNRLNKNLEEYLEESEQRLYFLVYIIKEKQPLTLF